MATEEESESPDIYELINQLRSGSSELVNEMFELNTKAIGVIKNQASDFAALAQFFDAQAARCRELASAGAELASLTAVATGDIINAEFLLRTRNAPPFAQMLIDENLEDDECDDDDEG